MRQSDRVSRDSGSLRRKLDRKGGEVTLQVPKLLRCRLRRPHPTRPLALVMLGLLHPTPQRLVRTTNRRGSVVPAHQIRRRVWDGTHEFFNDIRSCLRRGFVFPIVTHAPHSPDQGLV